MKHRTQHIAHLQFITQKMPNESIVLQVNTMLSNGIRWVQYRRKEKITDSQKRKELFEIKNICRLFESLLIVNDDVNLALEVGADGVHLGKEDMSPSAAREILGEEAIIGGTANTFEDIKALVVQSVDYIGLGPYQLTKTKKKLSPILGDEGYTAIKNECKKQQIEIPLIAVGGVQEADIEKIKTIDMYGVAIFSALYKSKNKQLMIEEIRKTFHHE